MQAVCISVIVVIVDRLEVLRPSEVDTMQPPEPIVVRPEMRRDKQNYTFHLVSTYHPMKHLITRVF